MPRLKRQGIEFFTLHTDYLHSRAVRRIMKREGEAAIAVLVETYAAIYAGEGYYVQAGPKLFDDLADLFFRLDADDVKRVLELAVDNELFDAGMYRDFGILTSAGIQSEFLYATRRRSVRDIDPRYRLLPADDEARAEDSKPKMPAPKAPADTAPTPAADPAPASQPTEEKETGNAQMYTGTSQMYTFTDEKRSLMYPGTHTTLHNTTLHNTTKDPLLKGSPADGETGSAGRGPAEEGGRKVSGEQARAADVPPANHRETTPPGKARKPAREWTQQDIAGMQPPQDGLPRNLEGLKYNLLQCRVPPREQYAIICKSNFGVIGHPVWRGFCTLRESRGKIKLPGRYLLSLC